VRYLAANALLVAGAYYAGANLGFMLRLPPATPSVLWPPNTILTAALLVSPPRRWTLYLLAALPAHVAAELGLQWPLLLILLFFATNCSQALIAAAGVRWFSDAPARFDTLRRTVVYVLAAGLAAPFLSSFADAAAVTATLGEPYWLVWRTRFFSNVLTELVLGPAIIIAITSGPAWLRKAPRAQKVEVAALTAALALLGAWAFGLLSDTSEAIPGQFVFVFLLPLILLLTVRFGPGGASLALLITTLIAISAGAYGRGPFVGLPPLETVLALQFALTTVAIPVLCLAADIVERRQATRALANQLRLEVLLSRLSAGFVLLQSDQMEPVFRRSVRQVGEAVGVDRVMLCYQLGPGAPVARLAWSASASDPGLRRLPEEHFPWILKRLRDDEAVVFSHLDGLPVTAARDVESLRRHGVRAGAIVPLARPRFHGALALLTSTERTWPDGLVQWLRLVAEIFANALARKEAEDALRASEVSKSAILASLSSAVAVLDRDGMIIDVNASWTRAAAEPGVPAQACLGVGANLVEGWRQAAGDGAPYAREAAAGIVEVLTGARTAFTLEYSSRGSRTDRWFVMSIVPLDDTDGGAVVSCTDISERKRAELDAEESRRELAHFTRVSTMGQLTASLAHELSQPLTGILSNARAGLRFLGAAPPSLEELRGILLDIVDDDKRAAEVIRRLRDLLRKGEEPNRILLDLNVLLVDVVRLLASDAIIRNVTMTLVPAARPVLVYGDRVELQQVVVNLVINAMEAMADGLEGDRTVAITTENDPPRRAHVAVRDTGPGLGAGGHDLIFEPFFTTKPAGMGMGLAIARTIIEGHGGVIWATANVGGGATFHFSLPAVPTESV
jgi:two-component system sensor kinase FixL